MFSSVRPNALIREHKHRRSCQGSYTVFLMVVSSQDWLELQDGQAGVFWLVLRFQASKIRQIFSNQFKVRMSLFIWRNSSAAEVCYLLCSITIVLSVNTRCPWVSESCERAADRSEVKHSVAEKHHVFNHKLGCKVHNSFTDVLASCPGGVWVLSYIKSPHAKETGDRLLPYGPAWLEKPRSFQD